MGTCFENQRGESYCVSSEVASSHEPAPGFSAPSNAAAQDAMWEARRGEIWAQWNQFGHDTQWQAVVAYEEEQGGSYQTDFFAGRLPHPQILWEWVLLAEDVVATATMWAENDARLEATQARGMYESAERILILAEIRVQSAKDRWSHYAHQANGTSFFGWLETKWAEYAGQIEMPDLSEEAAAWDAIERARAFVVAGDVEQIERLQGQMEAMEDIVNIWIDTMNTYVRGREGGGDQAVAQLTAVRNWSATFVATGMAPALGVEAVLGRAAISGGVSAGFEAVDQIAETQAGLRDGVSGWELLSTFLMSGAGSLFSSVMGPKILRGLEVQIGAQVAQRTGQEWAGNMVQDAIKRALSVPLKEGFTAVIDSLSGRREVNADDIVDAIENKLGAKLAYTVADALLAGE